MRYRNRLAANFGDYPALDFSAKTCQCPFMVERNSIMARKQPKPIHQLTVAQFERMFPDEDACCAYLVGRRWPEGVRCPRCGADNPHKLPNRPWSWQCYQCAPDTSYRFSHIAGTIFENTNKPLRDWYRVVHLMLTSKKGMSALQIKLMGFGSYETAWSMCHKVRVALMEDIDKLGGIVEVDETFVGGLAKNRHWDKRGGGLNSHAPSTSCPFIESVIGIAASWKTPMVPPNVVLPVTSRCGLGLKLAPSETRCGVMSNRIGNI